MTEIVIPPRGYKNKRTPLHKQIKVDVKGDLVKAEFWSIRTATWFITRIGLLILLLGSLGSTARVAATYLTVYPVTPTLLFSPEDERWELPSYPIVRMVRFINQNVSPDARIMVFRTADIAYYTDNPIVSFSDNNYADLFRYETPEELHRALLDLNVEYVVIPAYGKPEINRTVFKPFLHEGRFTALAFASDGERLFRVLKTPVALVREVEATTADVTPILAPSTVQLDPSAIQDEEAPDNEAWVISDLQVSDVSETLPSSTIERGFVRVREADLSSATELESWTAFLRPLSFFKTLEFGQPELTKPVPGAENPIIRIERERPFIAKKFLIDVLQAWPFQIQYSPIVRGKTEFPVENGVYRISGDVEADGKVDLYIRITIVGADQVTKTHQWLIWSEVLNGEAAKVRGTTAIAIPALDQLRSNLKSTDSAMLFFTLEQGGYLEVSKLTVDRLKPSSQISDFFDLVQHRRDAYLDGWTLGRLMSVVGYARPLDILQQTDDDEIRFRQVSGDSETVFSPPFIVSEEQIDVLEALSLERKGQQAPPQLNASFTARGNGAMMVGFFGSCSDGSEFSLDLRTYSLDPAGMAFSPSREAQCVPSLVRTAFTIDRDKFLYPPNFERAEAYLSDLSMTMTLWANDGQQRVIALRPAPELSTLDINANTETSTALGLPDLLIPNFDQ